MCCHVELEIVAPPELGDVVGGGLLDCHEHFLLVVAGHWHVVGLGGGGPGLRGVGRVVSEAPEGLPVLRRCC